MELKRKAGWNQIEADWRRFLDLAPDGCFLAELDDRAMGVATTCVLGAVGWIAMVLVDPEARGKGIGTALMRHALDYLDGRAVPTARLDATPMGQSIYEKLGFRAEYPLARMAGTPATVDHPTKSVSTPLVHDVRPDQIPAIVAFDRAITGTDRARLIERLFAETPESFGVVENSGRLAGYRAWRPGANAAQIGPCLAADPQAGSALLNEACRRLAGQAVFMDIPVDNQPALEWARSRGFDEQRRLLRMFRGASVDDRVEGLWASSGPEKG
jgi:ribosomal protein S18 acetylase RimI-like enzyme